MRTFKTALRIARAHKVYAIAFLVAVNMLGLITGMTQGGQTSDKLLDAKVNLAVVDRDHSPVSQGLAAYMEGSGNAVEVADSRRAMQDALARDEVELIVIIPEGLGDAVENAATQVRSGTSISDAESTLPRVGTVLAPSSAAAPLMAQQVTTYVGQVLTYRSTTAASADQAVGSTGISMKETAPASVIKGEGISMPQGLLVFFGMALYSLFAFTTNMLIQTFTVGGVMLFGGGAGGWRNMAIVYALIGLAINTLSVYSVKELSPEELEGENNGPEEDKLPLLESAKILFSNKKIIEFFHHTHILKPQLTYI